MCEFRVFRTSDGEEKDLAKDIVRFSYEEGHLTLYDIIGSRVTLDDSLVNEMNTGQERLDVIQLPGIGQFLIFLKAYSKAYASHEYDERLEGAWEEVKGVWDGALAQLRNTRNR